MNYKYKKNAPNDELIEIQDVEKSLIFWTLNFTLENLRNN